MTRVRCVAGPHAPEPSTQHDFLSIISVGGLQSKTQMSKIVFLDGPFTHHSFGLALLNFCLIAVMRGKLLSHLSLPQSPDLASASAAMTLLPVSGPGCDRSTVGRTSESD